MACACKVQTYINQVERRYGTKIASKKPSNIKGVVRTFFKKIIVALILIPFIPIILVSLFLRKLFTNKPITLDNFIKKKI